MLGAEDQVLDSYNDGYVSGFILCKCRTVIIRFKMFLTHINSRLSETKLGYVTAVVEMERALRPPKR